VKCVPVLDCPACYSKQHSVHIDGNKKLYRFSKVPRWKFVIMNTQLHVHIYLSRGSRKSYYDGAFIAKNEDVDDHLTLIGYCDETLVVRNKILQCLEFALLISVLEVGWVIQ